jgi:hypothetical protein
MMKGWVGKKGVKIYYVDKYLGQMKFRKISLVDLKTYRIVMKVGPWYTTRQLLNFTIHLTGGGGLTR